jgi:sugar-specific transcriptional regulator TrmB
MSGAAHLGKLGLTADEARSYEVLLARGRLTARELSSTTGITRGRIYEVIGGLLAKGLALETTATPRAFEAAPPKAAVENLLEKHRENLADLERSGEELLRTLRPPASGSLPPAFIETIHHGATLQERIEHLQNEASDEVLMFVRPPFFARSYQESDPEFQALKRGVELRCLFESSLLEDPERVDSIREYVDSGGQARHTASLPTKLAIFDRRITVLPLSEPLNPKDQTILLIRHAGLSELASASFHYFWDQAEAIRFPARVTAAK